MSSNNVDNRVVNLEFNNAQFEAGVKQTLGTLEELKKSLQFNTSLTGINTLSNAFNAFSVAHISEQIGVLENRFSTLGIVGMTAIQNITNKMMNLATGKISKVISQVQSGGWGRASSIAQARFTLQGLLKDEEKVKEAFNSASDAVDGTAYSLDAAVSVASQLAASGVDVGDEMKNTLLAIGGTAAMTGANFSEIGHVFTTVAGQGKVMTMQLRQLELRGINAAAEIAKSMNTTEADVREMVTKGEISFEEFSAAMQEAFGDHAKEANKTFSGSMANIRSALSRIGAIFASGIIENDDLIQTLNDVRVTINKIKEAMLPLEDKFKTLVSTVSKMVSTLIGDFKTDSLERFVDIIGRGMDTISGLINKWTNLQNSVKESIFGQAAEETKEAADAIYASAEQIEKAREVWFQGLHGVGQARKDEFGEEYDVIQYLINQLAAGNRDLENVAVNSVLETKEAEEELTEAVDETTDSTQNLQKSFFPIGKLILSFKSYIKGLKTIINGVKTTVTKAFTSFKKIFSIQDLIEDIRDYGEIFSNFVGYFELNEDRANKLETAFTGLWSALDLIRMVVKEVAGGLSKILGPVLSIIFDLVLSLIAKIAELITKLRNWYRENNLLRSIFETLGKVIKVVVEYVTTFFEKLNQLPAVQKIKDSLKELADIIGEKLLNHFKDATDSVNDFFDKMDSAEDNPIMLETLDHINSGLENFISFCTEAKDNYGGFIEWVTEKGEKLFGAQEGAYNLGKRLKYIKEAGKSLVNGDGISAFVSNLSYAFSDLNDKIDSFVDWIIKKFNSVDAVKASVMGIGSLFVSLGLSLSYVSWNLGNLLKSFASVPLAISQTILSVKGVFKSIATYIKNDSQAKLVKSYALAIAVLAASLVALTFVDPDKLKGAKEALFSLMGMMAATIAMVAFVATNKKADPTKVGPIMNNMALMFITLAAAAYILTAALVKLSEIDWNGDVWKPLATMAGFLLALVAVSFVISKIKGELSINALAMLMIAGSVYLLAAAMSKLNAVDINGIDEKISALASILFSMALFFILIKKLAVGEGTVNVLSVIGLIGAIWLIEIALQDIATYGITWTEIQQNIDKFYPVLVSLGIVVGAISILGLTCKNATKMGGTILAFAVSVLLMVYAIKKLADIAREGDLAVGIAALYTIFAQLYILIGILGLVAKTAEGVGKELLYISVAVGILAVLAYALGYAEIEPFLHGCALMVALISLVGYMALVTSEAKAIDYKSLYAMVVAVGVLTVAITAMSFIKDKLSLWESVGILGTGLLALGMALYLAGQYADKISVKSIVAMVLVIDSIAAALFLLANYSGGWENVLAAAGSMSLTLFVLGQAMSKIAETLDTHDFSKKSMLVLVEFIVMIGVIAGALWLLTTTAGAYGIDKLYASLGAILAILVIACYALAKVVDAIEFTSIETKAIIMLGVVIAMIITIAVSMKIVIDAVKGVQSELSAGLAIAGMLTAMFIICYGVSNLAKTLSGISLGGTVLGMMGIMVAIIISLGVAMSMIIKATKDSSPSKIVLSMAGLLIALFAVAGVMTYLSNNFSVFNPALLGQAIVTIALLFSVVIALNMLLNGNDADWSKILSSALAFAIVISVLVAAVSVLTMLTTATGLIPALIVLAGLAAVTLSLALAFKSFAAVAKATISALQILANLDLSNIDTKKLFELVGVLALAVGLGFIAGPAFISLAIGITALSVSITILAASLLLLAAPISLIVAFFSNMSIAINAIATVFDTAKDKIVEGIKTIATGLASGVQSFIQTISSNSATIVNNINDILTNILIGFYSFINKAAIIIAKGTLKFLEIIDEYGPQIIDKATNTLINLLAALAQNAGKFSLLGAVIISKFVVGILEGLSEYIDEILQAAADFAIAFIYGVADTIYNNTQPLLDAMAYLGLVLIRELIAAFNLGGIFDDSLAEIDAEIEYQKAQRKEQGAETKEAFNEGVESTESADMGTVDTSKAEQSAKVGGENVVSNYADSIKSKAKEKVSSVTGDITGMIDGTGLNEYMGQTGSDAANSLFDSANDEFREDKIDLSGMDDSIKQHYIDAGYEYSEDGKYLVKQIKKGSEAEAATYGDIWTNTADPALMSAMDDTGDSMTEKGEDHAENYIDGLCNITPEMQARVYHTYYDLAVDKADQGYADGAEINSPSKKAIRNSKYYAEGLIIGINEMAGDVYNAYASLSTAACNEAATMMSKISTIVQDDSIDWTPTLTPVVDSSQLQNGSNLLQDTFGSSALNMAANTSLSVNSSSQAALAAQVQNLSDQVKKLADTDYSKILEGVAINVDASTNVDGTPLKRMASKFTIQQIDDQTRSYTMALGGRA